MNRRYFLSSAIALGASAALSRQTPAVFLQDPNSSKDSSKDKPGKSKGIEKVIKTDAEWKQILTPEQYNIMRQKGTEAPYSSPLNNIHEKGIFECAACELPLFSWVQKFDSGTGWPSFWAPIKRENVREEIDKSLGNDSHRSALRAVRCPQRTRFRRWTTTDRIALLHERRGAEVCEEGLRVSDHGRLSPRNGRLIVIAQQFRACVKTNFSGK